MRAGVPCCQHRVSLQIDSMIKAPETKEIHVYKLLTAPQWAAAQVCGITTTALDAADGYVHLSSQAQLAETARLHFSGKGDVMMLRFAAAHLPDLRWEPSRGGQLFPHLYAPLEIVQANRVWSLVTDDCGAPVLPEVY
jgi:uncharacterized protein (DUF952 family)